LQRLWLNNGDVFFKLKHMEEKLKIIDEISTLVIGLDLDIYLHYEDAYERVCVSDVSTRISEKLFKLKVLIRQDYGEQTK